MPPLGPTSPGSTTEIKPYVQGKSPVFISKLHTLHWPDKLNQDEHFTGAPVESLSYRQSLVRDATETLVDEMVKDSATITADCEAFCDAFCCMFF